MENIKNEYIFVSPSEIFLPRKTKNNRRIALNLNTYRNLDYLTNNASKILYTEIMMPQLRKLKLKWPLEIEYTLWRKNKRRVDKGNFLCIVEKFFLDALKLYNCIPDDSDDYIYRTIYNRTQYAKCENKCIIKIKETKK